jgi:hypothetical protein
VLTLRINGARGFDAMGGTLSFNIKDLSTDQLRDRAPLLIAFAYCRCYFYGENIFTEKGGLNPWYVDDRELHLVKCFEPTPGA